MSDKALKQLLEVAAGLSERAADETGFVALASLARVVQADIRFRPLLVEGIAAQPKSRDGRWLILIDNETHRVTEDMLTKESAGHPLGARVRNTVAHELAHALGPRYEEAVGRTDRSRDDIVAVLEKDTEQLSPALLIPRRAVEALLKARSEPLGIEELVAARDRWGVSTKVFVKRFDLILQEEESSLRHHPRLDNIVIGAGEWLGKDRVELLPMPFKGHRGLIPEFASQLRARRKIAVAEYFPSPDFYLNGGSDPASSAEVWIGTAGSPQSERAKIKLAVDMVPRHSGEQFLWIAHSETAA
jgi:hypothetical protein